MLNLSRIINESKLLYHSEKTGYVLASYSEAFEVPEVLLFKATYEGQVKDWTEIYGEKFSDFNSTKEREMRPSSKIQSVVNRYNDRIVLGGEFYDG